MSSADFENNSTVSPAPGGGEHSRFGAFISTLDTRFMFVTSGVHIALGIIIFVFQLGVFIAPYGYSAAGTGIWCVLVTVAAAVVGLPQLDMFSQKIRVLHYVIICGVALLFSFIMFCTLCAEVAGPFNWPAARVLELLMIFLTLADMVLWIMMLVMLVRKLNHG